MADWGTVPDWIVAIAAFFGLLTVWFAVADYKRRQQDRERQYASNVGVSAVKEQGRATLSVKATNGNSAPVYGCVITVHVVDRGGNSLRPIKFHVDAFHPGPWEVGQALPGDWIATRSDIRFTDGNGRRWVRDSTGKLEPSKT